MLNMTLQMLELVPPLPVCDHCRCYMFTCLVEWLHQRAATVKQEARRSAEYLVCLLVFAG